MREIFTRQHNIWKLTSVNVNKNKCNVNRTEIRLIWDKFMKDGWKVKFELRLQFSINDVASSSSHIVKYFSSHKN